MRKLQSVGLFVAFLALRGGGLEIHVQQRPLEVRRPVTRGTVHRAVRPSQDEAGATVVEARHIRPRLRRVAGLAAERVAAGVECAHAHRELSLVGIRVARRATQVVEVERIVAILSGRLVAVVAGDREVPSREHKSRLLMARQVKRGRMERALVMAALAPVEIGCAGELVPVHVPVAIYASRDLDAEDGCSTRGRVALRALSFSMFFAQRKIGFVVVGEGELRRFESADSVARFALAAVSSGEKLPIVRVRLMAVGTSIVRYGRFKVAIAMAGFAAQLKVLAEQGILRLRVIELHREVASFPTRGAMARFAALLEGTAMRIAVARCTPVEPQPHKLQHACCVGGMALLTGDLAMQSAQRELRFRVIERARVLPVVAVVTLQAVRPQLALVLVLVTRGAGSGEA